MRKTLIDIASRFFLTRKVLFCAPFLLVVTLALSVVAARIPVREDVQAGEQCIMCHITTFNAALGKNFLHSPFFQKQCTLCHLPAGVQSTDSVQQNTTLTAAVVSQKDLWRKPLIFSASTAPGLKHLAALSSLNPETAYRFRIIVSSMDKESLAESDKGLWLGLRINEIGNLSRTEKIDFSRRLSGNLSNLVRAATVYRNGNTAFVAWETSAPLSGWVEVQKLEGLALTELTTETQRTTRDPDQHPPLKTPEELAINACYQCHPESSLGTSHPVRLYSGRDVRIPDDLPTVDGMLTCVTCHDPHGSDGKMLVREVIKTKLCVTCHYKYKNSSPSTMFQ